MKIRSILLLIAILPLMLLFSSCGKTNEANAAPTEGTNPQQGAFMRNQPDLYGEVKSVSGQQIEVALLEMPQRRQFSGDTGREMPESSDSGDRANGENRRRSGGSNNGGNDNSGGGVQGNNGDGANDENGNNRRPSGNRGFMGERKPTGESQTITVSEQTKISSFGRNSGDSSEAQMKISDIKAGSIIQVYYKKDSGDEKEIESIRILPVPNSN